MTKPIDRPHTAFRGSNTPSLIPPKETDCDLSFVVKTPSLVVVEKVGGCDSGDGERIQSPRAHMLFRMMICCLLAADVVSAPSQANQPNTAVGTWRGESKCMVTPSACRDEHSVYRIAAVAQSPTKVTLTANKLVDGREVSMGTSECSFSRETHALTCPLPDGKAIHFELKGDSLNGTMTLSDGTVWRKIALRRIPATHHAS